MFKLCVTKFLIIRSLYLCCLLLSSQLLAMEMSGYSLETDPRHILVRKVKADFAAEIMARQEALGTANSAVALVDIAKEYLERDVAAYADDSSMQWAMMIHHVLSGYGYDRGVAETLKATDAEQLVLCNAFSFSSAYLAAQGQRPTISDTSIFGNPAEVLAIVERLNRVAASVLDEAQEFTKPPVVSPELARLRTLNAWSSHERFWAVAGVLDPKIPVQLRLAFTAFAGTSFGFVTDLTTKLDHAIRAMAVEPTAQSVVDLVQLSQQTLLTLVAGTPGEADDAWVRLNPSNTGEWEIIRKALFLALSVSSNPESSGRTFLSTLYNCGSYFPKKADPEDTKTYYWRLEALANSFSKIWDGLKAAQADEVIQAQLANVVVQANPLDKYEKEVAGYNRDLTAAGKAPNAIVFEYSPKHAVLMAAYDLSIKALSLAATRGELAEALMLHPRLQHERLFHSLDPDLIDWVTYHEPSPRARELVSGDVVKLALPDGFTPQGVQLVYHGGKWILKALQLDAVGTTTGEEILWRQGANATETLVGELVNNQGRHLFSFDVNGAGTTIKAISSGYVTRVGGDGTTVTLAHGNELGLIESSAYPSHTDITTSANDAAISITSPSYVGSRGVLSATRNSVWVEGTSVSLWYPPGFDIKHHNGKPFKFHSLKGHGIEASKDVVLKGKRTDIPFSFIIAGQNVKLLYGETQTQLNTHGSHIKAGHEIEIDQNLWHGETQFTFAGTDDTGLIFNPADTTLISARAVIDSGRLFRYFVWNICFLHEAERNALARGAHVYGVYEKFHDRSPRFSHGVIPL